MGEFLGFLCRDVIQALVVFVSSLLNSLVDFLELCLKSLLLASASGEYISESLALFLLLMLELASHSIKSVCHLINELLLFCLSQAVSHLLLELLEQCILIFLVVLIQNLKKLLFLTPDLILETLLSLNLSLVLLE